MSIENLMFEFLEAAIASAAAGDVVEGLDLQETVYQTIKSDRGIRIGDCQSQLAPAPGGDTVEEFDALLLLVCYARVAGADKSNRMAAREQSLEIAKSLSKLLIDDPSMGGRVRDSRALRVSRGYDSIGSQPFAVCTLEVVVNETGQRA